MKEAYSEHYSCKQNCEVLCYVNEQLGSPYKETIEEPSPATCYLMQLAQQQLKFSNIHHPSLQVC